MALPAAACGYHQHAGLSAGSYSRIVWVFIATICLALPGMLGDNTFQVGMVYSATGPLADFWSESVNGTRMWMRQLNDVLGSSGLRITDGAGNTLAYSFNLTTADDASSANNHYSLVSGMLAGGVDFLFNGQPAFAVNESMVVDTAKRINMHGFTGNDEVFTRDLKGVFGVSQSNRYFAQDLMNEYRVASIFSVMFVYRDDIPELRSACEAAIAKAAADLVKVTAVVKYQASDAATMDNVAKQISATTTEVLFGCSLTNEAAQLVKLIDQLKKPLKSIVFTNGPLTPSFSASLGNISQYLMTPAPWFQTLPSSDSFYGKASDFSVKYSTLYGNTPAYVSAGTAAAGFVLQQALQAAFATCNISATGGDVKNLLYSTNLLNCSDNNNNGRLRLITAMQQTSVDTFYGTVSFDKFRQNYISNMRVMQVFQTVSNLKQVLLPAVVMPLSDATAGKKVPQLNRYAPVCQPGTYAGPDRFLPCIPCPVGSFQEFSGQASCELCPRSTYQNVTGQATCQACPANSETSLRGATNSSDCTCMANFWTNARTSGVACSKCPINSDCAGGVALPQPDEGWYAEPQDPSIMYNCNPNYVCQGDYQCAPGYAGRMCAYCAPGYYMAFTRCWSCTSPAGNLMAMLAMYVFFFLLNVSVSREFESFHVLMNFCQYLSVINAFNVNWPNTLNIIMNYLSVLSFEMDIIQPQCAVPSWSFEMNLYVQVIAPAAILMLVLMWTAFTWTCYRVKMRIMGKDGGVNGGSTMMSSTNSMHFGSINPITGSMAMDATATSSWWLLLQGMVHIPSDRAEMYELFLDRMSIPLMFLNIGYLALLKYLLAAFYCYDFAGTMYIYYSPNDLCYTPKHYRMMMVAATGLIVYVGGLWFMVIHVLRHLRRTRDFGGKKPLLLFGWLYERYKAEYHWYEITQMVQKTVYVLVMVFLLPDPVLQVLVCLVLSIGCAMIDVQTAAMVSNTAHILQTAADAALAALLILGLVFFNSVVLTRTTTLCYYSGLILIIVILALLLMYVFVEAGLHIMIVILMARHNRLAKKWGHSSKQFKHMYTVFEPIFMVRWLFKAQPEDWMQWHKLCIMLQHTVHPTNETSYLSIKKIGRFWRYLLDNFPETVDFLVTCEPEHRENFGTFIEVMYADFFDSQEELPVQLNMVVTEKHKASLSQWLASAEESEIQFIRDIMTNAFGRAQGEESRREITRALSRSAKSSAIKRDGTNSGYDDGGLKDRGESWGLQTTGGGDYSLSGISGESPLGGASLIRATTDISVGRAVPNGTVTIAAGGKNFADLMRGKAGRESAPGFTSAPMSPLSPSVIRPSIKSAQQAKDSDDSVSPFAADNAEIAPGSPFLAPPPRASRAGLRFSEGAIATSDSDAHRLESGVLVNGGSGSLPIVMEEPSRNSWPALGQPLQDSVPEPIPVEPATSEAKEDEPAEGLYAIGVGRNGSRTSASQQRSPPSLSPRAPDLIMKPVPPATTPPAGASRPLQMGPSFTARSGASSAGGSGPIRPSTAQELAVATQELLNDRDLQLKETVAVSPRLPASPREQPPRVASPSSRIVSQSPDISVDALQRIVDIPTLDMESVMASVEQEAVAAAAQVAQPVLTPADEESVMAAAEEEILASVQQDGSEQ